MGWDKVANTLLESKDFILIWDFLSIGLMVGGVIGVEQGYELTSYLLATGTLMFYLGALPFSILYMAVIIMKKAKE